MSDTPPDPAPLLHATALLERFGGHLTEWQREMFLALVGPGGVSSRLVLGRGRRAGWTVLMATVENALRSRALESRVIWDGSEAPEDWRDEPFVEDRRWYPPDA